MLTGVNLTALRDRNTAAVLALVRAGPVSQVEIAERTGLTVQAISKIVQRLLRDGMVTEAGRAASTGGKPRTLLRLVPDARYAVGAHLDRDAMTVLLADLAGNLVTTRSVPGKLGSPKETLDLLALEVERLIAEVPRDRVLGVGLACPGPLDQRTGVLHQVTRLPVWHGLPLQAEAAARLGLPTVIEKDCTAAVLSQSGSPDRAFIYLADGLGAGFVLGGRVHRGANTNAGEFGHQVLDPSGPLCGCGNRGCLETLTLQALRDDSSDQAAAHLAVGVTNLVRLLDLDQIILGGHTILNDPDPYLKAITAPRVGLAQAGHNAVALGAASLVLAPLFS